MREAVDLVETRTAQDASWRMSDARKSETRQRGLPALEATVAALQRVLATAGCDLHDLARAINPTHTILPALPPWRERAGWCLRNAGGLRPAEADFLRSLIQWRGEPTPKQLRWLNAIHEALASARRAA